MVISPNCRVTGSPQLGQSPALLVATSVPKGSFYHHFEDHAAYLASWLKVLKDDKRAIFQAASHAQRAVDYLHRKAGYSIAEPELDDPDTNPDTAPTAADPGAEAPDTGATGAAITGEASRAA